MLSRWNYKTLDRIAPSVVMCLRINLCNRVYNVRRSSEDSVLDIVYNSPQNAYPWHSEWRYRSGVHYLEGGGNSTGTGLSRCKKIRECWMKMKWMGWQELHKMSTWLCSSRRNTIGIESSISHSPGNATHTAPSSYHVFLWEMPGKSFLNLRTIGAIQFALRSRTSMLVFEKIEWQA